MTVACVLVVDDEAPIIELVRRYLEREGMEVIAASDGQVGLDLIRERAPDVVVLDVNLPGLDGFEVLPPRSDLLRCLRDHAHRPGRRDRPDRRLLGRR